MKRRASLIAYVSIALSLCAWAAVVFFALSIETMSQTSIDLAASAQATSDQQTTDLQAHEFAKVIAPARTQFENILKSDPLSLSSTLTEAGKDAGVALQIDNAAPESSPASSGAHVAAIGFVLQATGSFASTANR